MTTRAYPRRKNLALRRARQSMRLSQAQFAEAIRVTGNAVGAPNRCTKRLVQKWENGEHAGCSPDYLTVLQVMTGLPGRDLGFQMPSDYTDAAGTVVDQAIEEDGPGNAEVVSLGMAELCTDAMVDGSMGRLRHALDNPAAVGDRTASFVELATARLFDVEHHSPARLLARTVERHLSMVTALLTAARAEKVRRSLTVSSGYTALLAGWLAFDRGDVPAMHQYWCAATGAAQQTADEGLFAATLMCQSYDAARCGDPGAAWELAHTAAMRTPADRRTTAWATSRVALYAAQLGDHDAAGATMRCALEIGLQLPDPRPGDGSEPWNRAFDGARLLSTTAHTAALLGEPNAIEFAVRAVAELAPVKVKSRAVALAEAALVAAIVGEHELCLDYGSPAAALAHEMDVSLATDLLRAAIPHLLPHAEDRAVRELLPQLVSFTQTGDLYVYEA